MKRLLLCFLVVMTTGLILSTGAQAMPVSEFLATAERIPNNPTALLRSDTRRLMREMQSAFETVRRERRAAVEAGRPPAYCPPDGARLSLNAESVLTRFRAIPESRRHISVTQAVREWMTETYPC